MTDTPDPDAFELPSHANARKATLPDAEGLMDPREARPLVDEFRRVRDRYRGRFVAPAEELPADGVRVATACASLAATATREERRHLLEDLVDLQSFVPDAPTDLAPPAVSDQPGVTALADPLIEAIRWRQAAVMAFSMGRPTVIGDHNAIRGRWSAIGDARAAIDLANEYREEQMLGIGAIGGWLLAAPLGFLVAVVTGLARPTIVAIIVLAAGWLASPFIGAAAGWLETRLERSAWLRAHPAVAGPLEWLTGLGLVVGVPFLAGIVVTTVSSRLGLP